ncbi:hypothetical protein F4Y93_03700 [Candidatus Poribacteria bacterium]|nr:hypothetical protein [Candidatus Poribacteria bacterium]
MLKFLISTKMLIAGLIFCVLTISGSLYYYLREVRLANQQLAETDAFLQRLNERNAARTTPATQAQTRPDPHASLEVAEISTDTISAEADAVVVDVLDIPSSNETLQLEPVSAEVPLSSSDFIPQTKEKLTKEELKTLVEQKLREQGIPVRSSFMENGLVYPLIRNVVYVEWDQSVDPGGSVIKHLSLTIGLPDDVDLLNTIYRKRRKYFSERDIPPHMRLIPYGEGGIDPYQFLNSEL